MIKKLVKVGNSQALIFDRTTLDMMGLREGDEVQITPDGGGIRVSPAHVGLGSERIKEHTRAIREQFGETLKRLA